MSQIRKRFSIYFAVPNEKTAKVIGIKIGATPFGLTSRRVRKNLSDSTAYKMNEYIEVSYTNVNVPWRDEESAYLNAFASKMVRGLGKDICEWFRVPVESLLEFAKKRQSLYGKRRVKIEHHEVL
jgi:hypothetical protein